MRTDQAAVDLMVFAKDYPEVRMVVEVKSETPSPQHLDAVVKQVARNMWGANCHYGLIFTPVTTYVLRDDFTTHGSGSIHVTDAVATEKLLGRLGTYAMEGASEREFVMLVRQWLELLATSYETALPDDADVTKAFFPEIVGAVTDGRVVTEDAVR